MQEYDFRLAGKYQHYFQCDEKHIIVLFEIPATKTKQACFIELEVYDELVDKFLKLEQGQIIGVEGHFISYPRSINYSSLFMNIDLVVDKLYTRDTQ